jgi:hypothetical protein
MLFGAFQLPSATPSAATTDFSRGAEDQELASISLCPVYIYVLGNHTGTL